MDEPINTHLTIARLTAALNALEAEQVLVNRELDRKREAIVTSMDIIMAEDNFATRLSLPVSPESESAGFVSEHPSGYKLAEEVLTAPNLPERLVQMARVSGKPIMPKAAAEFLVDNGLSRAVKANLRIIIYGALRESGLFTQTARGRFELLAERDLLTDRGFDPPNASYVQRIANDPGYLDSSDPGDQFGKDDPETGSFQIRKPV